MGREDEQNRRDTAKFYNLWFGTCKMFEKSGSPINTFTAQTKGEWVVMTQKTETFVPMTRCVKPILPLSAQRMQQSWDLQRKLCCDTTNVNTTSLIGLICQQIGSSKTKLSS